MLVSQPGDRSEIKFHTSSLIYILIVLHLITALFGFIPRECPQDPLPELFPVRKCSNDQECWPRICCFDDNELTGFCRMAIPAWDKLPMPRIVSRE